MDAKRVPLRLGEDGPVISTATVVEDELGLRVEAFVPPAFADQVIAGTVTRVSFGVDAGDRFWLEDKRPWRWRVRDDLRCWWYAARERVARLILPDGPWD